MRIFTITDRDEGIEKKLEIGFSERFSKLPRHLTQYTLSIQATTGSKINDLRVLIIGFKGLKANKADKFNSYRLRVTESKKFERNEIFLKFRENIPVPTPLVIVYKKNVKNPIAAELTKILESYYGQLVEIHKKNFNALKNPTKSEEFENETYKAEIEDLGHKLFLEISKKDFDVDVKGVLLDKFFVHNNQQSVCLERNFDTSILEVDEKIPDMPENPQPKNPQVDFFCDKEAPSNLYIWSSPKLKEDAKKIISTYQKHLSKQYFFRSKGDDFQAKLRVSRKLLSVLEEKPEDFIDYLNKIDESGVLDVHRDSSIVQKIGKFFKGDDNKTKGRSLINELLAIVADDRALMRGLDLNGNSLSSGMGINKK